MTSGKKLTEEQKSRIIQLRREGLKPAQISKRLGLSVYTISSVYAEWVRTRCGSR